MPTAKRKPSTTITRSQQLYLRCPTCSAGPWRDCVLADGVTYKKTAHPSRAKASKALILRERGDNAILSEVYRKHGDYPLGPIASRYKNPSRRKRPTVRR